MTKFHQTDNEHSYETLENEFVNIHTHGDQEIVLTKKDLIEMLDFLESEKNHCQYCGESFNDIVLHAQSKCQDKHKKPDAFEKTAVYILENLTDRRGIKHAIYEDQKAHVNEWIRILHSDSNPDILATEIIQASSLIGSFDNEWQSCDDDIQQEIKNSIATIIKQSLNR